MKLRLRRHGTRETLKFELPDAVTLHELRRRISDSSPSTVHFSLNRKEELHASSPDEPLTSLGITSGDLIYYTFDPSSFLLPSQELADDVDRRQGRPEGRKEETLVQDSNLSGAVENGSREVGSREFHIAPESSNSNINYQINEKSDQSSHAEEQIEGFTSEISGMEVAEASIQADTDDMDIDYADLERGGTKRLSEPYFLKKVLMDVSSDASGLTVLVIAAHAVMLESGFVRFDPLLGVLADKLSFSNAQQSVSLWYTLPELTAGKVCLCLKFQSLGHVVNVNGSLGRGSSVYRAYLDKRRFVSAIGVVMQNLKCDKEGSSGIPNEVFEFWKIVKDSLVLPLLIDLCDKTGLSLPPCMMRLPTELKLKILELVPGVEIARTACVCSEMRYLASNNDLWKQKCIEVMGREAVEAKGEAQRNWKGIFVSYFENQKRLNNALVPHVRPSLIPLRPRRIWRVPYPFGFPGPNIQGDHDRFPGGVVPRFGPLRGGVRRLRHQNFFPTCNLGGFNA